MTRYEKIMMHLALIRTVGVVFVVLCWMFTIYRVIADFQLP